MVNKEMASLTQEYKRSPEYQQFRSHILNDAPTLPEYLVDMVISLHLNKPLMYRDRKVVREGMLKKSPAVPAFETLEGHVTVTSPE